MKYSVPLRVAAVAVDGLTVRIRQFDAAVLALSRGPIPDRKPAKVVGDQILVFAVEGEGPEPAHARLAVQSGVDGRFAVPGVQEGFVGGEFKGPEGGTVQAWVEHNGCEELLVAGPRDVSAMSVVGAEVAGVFGAGKLPAVG